MIASSLQKDTVLAALMIEPAMRAWSAKVAPVARWTHGDQLRRFATLVMVDMRGLQIDWPYALRPDREARRAVCDPAFLAFPAGSLFAGPRQLAPVARVLLAVMHGELAFWPGAALRTRQREPRTAYLTRPPGRAGLDAHEASSTRNARPARRRQESHGAGAREQSETFPCGTPCTVGRKYGMLTESKWLVVLPAC